MTKYDTQGAFDKLGQDPFLPAAPAPAPKKSRKGWVIAGLLVAAIGVGAAVSDSSGENLDRGAAPVSAGVETDTTTELVADMVQDEAIATGDWAIFCEGIDVLDYELAYSYFADGYGSDDAESRAAFDELASRC